MTRSPLPLLTALALAAGVASPLFGQDDKDTPRKTPLPTFRTEEIDRALKVGYCVIVADVNGDGKPDIVVADTNRVVWYENPNWKARKTLLEGKTKIDNVSITAADIDGDGKVDFALGAGWKPFDTKVPGTLQWLRRGQNVNDEWTLHPIPCEEPTVHRIRFADIDGDGKPELLVAPLMGRDSSNVMDAKTRKPGANWMNGRPVRLLAYKIPADPVKGPWVPTVINETLHVIHNFWPIPSESGKGMDILTASYEGVSLLSRGQDGSWSVKKLGEGNQSNASGNRGSSEVKLGRLRGGRKYIATIEPWHGNQVVVYTPSSDPNQLWERHVLDARLRWGHAVVCADLDGDGDEEVVIGVRDNPLRGDEFKDLRGVRVYRCTDGVGKTWERSLIDPDGVAVEDLTVADLNGDGRPDIIAVGRATGNVRIYWNEGPPPSR